MENDTDGFQYDSMIMIMINNSQDMISYSTEDTVFNFDDIVPYIFMTYAVLEYALIATMFFGNVGILLSFVYCHINGLSQHCTSCLKIRKSGAWKPGTSSPDRTKRTDRTDRGARHQTGHQASFTAHGARHEADMGDSGDKCWEHSLSKNSSRLTPSGRLVLNLSFADMLVGIGLCYFSLFKFWPQLAARLALHRVPCLLRFSVCFFTMVGSHCALLAIALDRYCAIVHTLRYKDVMTTRISWCMAALSWVLPSVGAATVFFDNTWSPDIPSCDEHYVVPDFLFHLALPVNIVVLLLVSLIHYRIHREVRAYSQRCADPQFVASPAERHRQGSKKSAFVLLQVTGTFILCWTPLDIMLITLVLVQPTPIIIVIFEFSFMMAMTSFLVNPFVYAWKTEAIRKPLVNFLTILGVYQLSRSHQTSTSSRQGVYVVNGQQLSVSCSSTSTTSTSNGTVSTSTSSSFIV